MEKLAKYPLKTALHQAILDNRLHQVRLLVETHGVKVDSKDVFGRTPLMLTCLMNDASEGDRMMKILLRAGAYACVTDNMNRTALHYACMKGRENAVKRFLKEGISNFNGTDSDGNSPLGYAAMSGHPQIVEILIDMITKFGINIDERNVMGYTPLLLACRYGNYQSANCLLKKGNSQPQLRDNEFFCNARDWTLRSGNLSRCDDVKKILRTKRAEKKIKCFERETTIYQSHNRKAECNHVKNIGQDKLNDANGSFKLPDVFNSAPRDTYLNTTEDLRHQLLDLIDSCSPGDVTFRLPAISQSCLVFPRRRPQKCDLEPNLNALFTLYSEQYRERCQRQRQSRDSRDTRRIKIQTPTSMSCDLS